MTTYQQTDWTLQADTSLQDHISENCPVCGHIIFDFGGVGRKQSYCSDACKMKSYRQRKKALRFATQNDTALDQLPHNHVRLESVGSASNTHTKVWYPILNSEKGQV